MQPPNHASQIEELLPVLVHISTHLEEDLNLAELSSLVKMSPFHFQRIFKRSIGETPKQYTQRLKLERSAYHLKISNASILDVAFDAGFKHHETFSRAFKRHFKVTPKAFKKANRLPQMLPSVRHKSLNTLTSNYKLSAIRIQKLADIHLAFIRHLGPYAEADASHFDTLIAWAKGKGSYSKDNLLIGVGHDDPGVTSAEKLRFDACIQVPQKVEPEGNIGFQTLPKGLYATASYVGPYGPTLEQALGELFRNLFTLKDYKVIGLPLVEIYRTTKINPEYQLNHTDIFVPVHKLGEL